MSPKFRVSHANSAQRRKVYVNPFFLFLAEFRQHLKNIGQRYKVTDETKLAGKQWRQMSANEKLIYVTWAKKNREIKYHQRGKVSRYAKNLNKVKVLLAPSLNPFVSSSMTTLKKSASMARDPNSPANKERCGQIQKAMNFSQNSQTTLPEIRRKQIHQQTNLLPLPRPRDPRRFSRMDTRIRWINSMLNAKKWWSTSTFCDDLSAIDLRSVNLFAIICKFYKFFGNHR